jgi:hypothetical protein
VSVQEIRRLKVDIIVHSTFAEGLQTLGMKLKRYAPSG